jgi:hypothetical protein
MKNAKIRIMGIIWIILLLLILYLFVKNSFDPGLIVEDIRSLFGL